MSTGPRHQPDVADASVPPATSGHADALAELMRQGDRSPDIDPRPPTLDLADVSPRSEPRRRVEVAHAPRRWSLAALLAVDLALLVTVIVWPLGSPSLDAIPVVPRPETFAIGDQQLVQQAAAQAAAGRFDAAIVDLELHLASHPRLSATERRLVNRALAIFAAHAGRAADAAAFEARLDDAAGLRALLDQARVAERAGLPDQMRVYLAAIVGAGNAPPSLLTEVASMLLRAGDGTPIEPARSDASPR